MTLIATFIHFCAKNIFLHNITQRHSVTQTYLVFFFFFFLGGGGGSKEVKCNACFKYVLSLCNEISTSTFDLRLALLVPP